MITIKKSVFKELYDLACEGWKKRLDEIFKGQLFTDQLEFDEKLVQEMKSQCTPPQLVVFNKIFKEVLPEDLFSKIKSYADVCKALGIKEATEENFKQFAGQSKQLLALHKIKNIETLFNGDWKANLKNSGQNKWYPYFNGSSGGLVFWNSGFNNSFYSGYAGLYRDRQTAAFVGRTFASIYQDLHI